MVRRVADVDALLALGHGWLVADGGNLLLDQRIHQRRFADVGDAHDHQAQRLDRIAAMRRQLLGQPRNTRNVAGLLAGNGDSLDAGLLLEYSIQALVAFRIGQIGLVQQLEAGALPKSCAVRGSSDCCCGLRQAGVKDLDHDIGHGQRFAGLLAGRGHVPREPLNRHYLLSFQPP